LERYRRADVLRILHISARQLAGWERAGLISLAETYSFSDLLQIKKLRDLRSKKVRPAVIRESLAAMQRQVSGMQNPLLEAGVFSHGSKLAFRHHGAAVEPIAGQFVLDFDHIREQKEFASEPQVLRAPENVAELFTRAVALEENPDQHRNAIDAYRQVLELDPAHAAACINLGTIYYNHQDFVRAEQYYRRAIEVDAQYALAYFDLGNVLDETGRLEEAVGAYTTALRIAPTYADAHYNVALAYERLKQPRKALRHWQAYLRVDSVGPWANHARGQIRKVLANEKLQIVYRRR
jgi:tetratricopeptide (TPR) repeat protein